MWDRVKSIVGDAAPLIGTLLGGPAGAGVGALVAKALGVANQPDAIEKALTDRPDTLLALKQLEMEHDAELQRLAIEAERIASQERSLALARQHATMQAEIASHDPYVRRWRPTWGYTLCVSWIMTFLGIFIVMLVEPSEAARVIAAVVELMPLFSIALVVLGVNIHKRSQDKQVLAGKSPVNLFSA